MPGRAGPRRTSVAADIEPQNGESRLLADRDLSLRSVLDTTGTRHASQSHDMRAERHLVARENPGIRLYATVDPGGFNVDPQHQSRRRYAGCRHPDGQPPGTRPRLTRCRRASSRGSDDQDDGNDYRRASHETESYMMPCHAVRRIDGTAIEDETCPL